MELVQTFEEKEVRRLLTAGPDGNVEEAFTQIDAQFRKRFVKGARDRIAGLGAHDLADAWQEALRDLFRSVQLGQFDPECGIAPWLWRIFIRRAFDQLRRRERYAQMLDGLRERLVGTTVGDHLERIEQEERRHLMERIRRLVGILPDRERTVVQTFVDHFPASEDKEALRQRVSERTGLPETRVGVSRALEAARRKVAGAIRASDS
jgi:RNA polymerase sigma factor (sigma-70 family)